MPRCAAKGNLVQRPGDTTLGAPDGPHVITNPWIFSVEDGHWHHSEYVNSKLVMKLDTSTELPAISVVVRWSYTGSNNSTPKIFFPDGIDIPSEAIEGLRRMFGFAAGDVGVYTSMTPAPAPDDNEWLAWECLVGDVQPDGTEITEVIVIGRGTKGGWVFARPDSAAAIPGRTGPSIDLPPIRFAIVGARDGALFAANRTLYFQTGVDANIRASVRTQFGFAAGAGEDASIEVIDEDGHPLIRIEPKD